MNIRLVSTLTPEDESRIAEALCLGAGALLEHLEIAYTLRIETSDGQVFQQQKAPPRLVRASSVMAT
jgi:hypothetical protein